jgi:hypothetical protein
MTSTSDFYNACRDGKLDEVREKLSTMNLEDIDRMEPNGSTALHVACYRGHKEIVKLLLDKGARRSLLNKYKNLPYDESESDEIKALFRRQSAARFADDGSGHIDWMKCDASAANLARVYRFRHNGFGWNSQNIDHRMKYIREQMPKADLERISAFLNQAETDPHCLLRAYTVESDFYRILNKDLAMKHYNDGTNFGITYFIEFFYNNPTFENLSFKGKVYRGMNITQDDLKQYSVGGKIMCKAFMSTTKVRYIAEGFAAEGASARTKQHGELVKLSALCTYEIINNRTGLSIEGVSEYNHEKEVLVGPYSAFTITAIRQIRPNYVEIDLRECEEAPNVEEDNDDDDDDDD